MEVDRNDSRRRRHGLVTGLVLAVILLSAEAYVQNPDKCKMPDSSIGYYFSAITSPYQIAFTSAESAWDSTTAWGYFHSTTYSAANIRVYDYAYGASEPIAWTAGACSYDSVWNNGRVDIRFNQTKMDSYPTLKKKATAAHELGHAYGLAHTEHYDCHDQVGHSGIMTGGAWTYNNCSWSTPKTDDVAGVNYVY